MNFDRRLLLLELGKAGLLTKELSYYARTGSPISIKRMAMDEHWSKEVCDAIHVPFIPEADYVKIDSTQAEFLVNSHLNSINFSPVDLVKVTEATAQSKSLHPEWEILMNDSDYHWALDRFEFRVARIMCMAGNKAWNPLVELYYKGYTPYGLSATGEFMVVEK